MTETETNDTVGLGARVRQFYAVQMRLLDSGEAEAWADTFTEDAVFEANAHKQPTRGRRAIAAAARAAAAELRAAGTTRRHWLGMCDVAPEEDGTVRVYSYALIIETPAGGPSVVRMSTTCEDLLVDDGGLRVRHRIVARDDIVP
ncbi:nuclear transport factor 2 family protein [Actinomadura violacea]|uniref:Nuclear transport factor 2 family protein n=1 Tax=Actinomadura violacea TaxID=2819934 RepID=A0ABS3RLM0_9ACTN|nr:nuclear transport factor 2 family protein [Actinomadura violacea]MBO2457458.1 nuclear transport factor 2 family protein [Actinomadura violacea]